jgi:thioredoxin reductase (NADPH)
VQAHQLAPCVMVRCLCSGTSHSPSLVEVTRRSRKLGQKLFLTKFASTVYLIHRSETFRASRFLVQRARANDKIKFIVNSDVADVHGEEVLVSADVVHRNSGEVTVLPIKGLFYAIGHTPNTAFLSCTGIELDQHNYILTGPGTTKTNIPGIFACGDVQDKRYRQAITSAGSGCMAALDANAWLGETGHSLE